MSLKKFLLSFTFVKQLIMAGIIVVGSLFLFMYWIDFSTNHGEEIKVPDVSKLSLEQAIEKLEDANLEYELLDTVDYIPNFPKYSIVDQNPIAGSMVKEDRIVYLKMNAGTFSKVALPNLIQKTYRQAVPTLIAIGLQVGDTTYIPNLAKDIVLGMKMNGKELKPGQEILERAKIDLILGDGKVGFDYVEEETIDSIPTTETTSEKSE